MSVPTAEPPAAALGPSRAPTGHSFTRWFAGGRVYLWLAGLALAIGALSLLIPSTPSYDPWSWLVWGREILHGSLHTPGGPTWKPLPVIFTTIFALFGGAQPFLWLVVARAGAVLSVFMVCFLAAKLTWRLGAGARGDSRLLAFAPPAVAGLIGLVSLAFTGEYLSSSALGYSEGLMVAATLIALDRHIDGHRRSAFVLGFVAALDRPEIWLFWGPYGLWLMWRDKGARALVVGLALATLFLWFVPQKWGGGSWFSGVTRAQHPRHNSPAFAPCPFCAELKDHAWPLVMLRIKVPAGLAVLAAVGLLWRGRVTRPGWRLTGLRDRALLTLVVAGIFGLAWWIVVALETQGGFSGNDRYLVLGSAFIVLVGAIALGWLAQALAGVGARMIGSATPPARRPAVVEQAPPQARFPGARRGLAPVAALLVGVLYLFGPNWVGSNLIAFSRTHSSLVYQANLRRDLVSLIARAGGADELKRCGAVMTEGFQVPMVAWYLNLRTLQVLDQPPVDPATGVAQFPSGTRIKPPATILQARNNRSAPLLPLPDTIIAWEHQGAHYRYVVGRHHAFRFFQDCSL